MTDRPYERRTPTKLERDVMSTLLTTLGKVLDAEGVFILAVRGHDIRTGHIGPSEFTRELPQLLTEAIARMNEGDGTTVKVPRSH